uniref:Cytochrome c oxidase subunit 3 n=1 Tax=Aguriahana juglandis TaxID=2893140 RepID=A0A9E6XTG9_9HEMI|nr:cytochrome c oxidase subunit III [Aguriahana juglandis]UGN61321.1 cytochrome c oxidase subunit III [Aguriahana juglandis]
MNNHPFHLVDKSPWPITGTIGVMTTLTGMVMWFHNSVMAGMLMGNIIIIMTMIQWWRDVIREASFQGIHTYKVILSMKIGMMMFILSEILFFMSFFWSFFHSSLAPTMEIGMKWPPLGIITFNPINIPMLNTMILLGSGISITWAHNELINKNYSKMNQAMIITVMLGVYFSLMQLYEYIESPFCISDSVYGSTFFMATGFHGLHVIIGTIFILVSTSRNYKLHFSDNHHVGFEASAWYWHFVDVVWLFLYMSIYWWGS